MTSDTWENVIAPEVMRQCDAQDGVGALGPVFPLRTRA